MTDRPDTNSFDAFDDLFREVDARLREAERLRNFVEHQQRSDFYPERRRNTRVPQSPDENDRRRS